MVGRDENMRYDKDMKKKASKRPVSKKSPVKKTGRSVAKKNTRKVLRKATKKTLKRKPATVKKKKKAARRSGVAQRRSGNKPIGVVTHFYNEIGVAIVRFKESVPIGTVLHFRGATTDFKHPVRSMQYEHEALTVAPKGKQIGIKVPKRVREGDQVHRAA